MKRALQRRIIADRDRTIHFNIWNPATSTAIVYAIAMKYKRPITTVQDSKHARKTARNQLFSGVRIPVIGNYPALYRDLRDLANHATSSLYKRDVERVDKQDDRVAERLFPSQALDTLLKHYPEQHALTIYLFIMGKLVDAWQNRRVSHAAREQMALRARFFIMAWRAHVEQHPDHHVSLQFISRESCEIFLRLADSLIELVFIHWRFFDTRPLLPWLHSTEACEHLFGILCKLKADFNFADVIYLEPKLRTLMLGAFCDLTSQEQANATASGYHYTYFGAPDLDLQTLATWPSDDNLSDAAKRAADDVGS